MKTKTTFYHRTFAFAYVLLVAVIFCGCDSTVSKNKTGERYFGSDIEVLTVDSCEYLIFAYDTRSITHKGNCKFCVERSKKIIATNVLRLGEGCLTDTQFRTKLSGSFCQTAVMCWAV